MCSETHTRKFNRDQHSQEEWERMQAKFQEFGAKFNAKMKESNMWGHRADKHVVNVTLPNERQFSFNIGHVVLLGLAIWLLPFNLILLVGLIAAAIYFGSDDSGEKRKRHDSEKPKNKAKVDETPEFEVYNV